MIRISAYVLLAISLSACSLLPGGRSKLAAPDDRRNDSLISNNAAVAQLVANDLVGVLSQIDIIEPAQTTLYIAQSSDPFGEKIATALQQAGYRLRITQADQQPLVSYNIQKDSVEAGYTVIVSAGLVKVKRSYDVYNATQTVMPASSIFVLGANANNIELNDDAFATQLATQPATVPATVTSVPPKREAIKTTLRKQPPVNIALNPELKPANKTNMYQTRRSNFEQILNQFNTVQREVMVFPNDSLLMGAFNKQVTREIVDRFRADTDVVSVIGCSHGKTAIDDGNRKLANGRAERVREEFLLAGINSELVLHEACWANVHFDEMMPRRGVVVDHKRLGD